MKSARGARKQPLMLSITTAGDVNDGIFDELYTRSTRFLEGRGREKRILPFIYKIDDVDLWDNIEELKKANPNLVKVSFPTIATRRKPRKYVVYQYTA